MTLQHHLFIRLYELCLGYDVISNQLNKSNSHFFNLNIFVNYLFFSIKTILFINITFNITLIFRYCLSYRLLFIHAICYSYHLFYSSHSGNYQLFCRFTQGHHSFCSCSILNFVRFFTTVNHGTNLFVYY